MKTLYKNWWILGAQGIFLLAVGALAVFNADIDLYAFIQYLGLIFLGFGTILGFMGLRSRKRGKHWMLIFSTGLLQGAVGLLILANPGSSSEIFTLIIGGWALLMAIIQLIIGFMSKQSKIVFFVNALISGVFGALIIWYKFDDQRSLTTLVGIYSVILGITIFYYAVRLKMWSGKRLAQSGPAKPPGENEPAASASLENS